MSCPEAKLGELENKLKSNVFVGGSQPNNQDADAFEQLIKCKCVPDQDKYPYVFGWYSLMILFEDEVIKSWKSGKCEKKQEQKQEQKQDKKQEQKQDKKDKKGGKKESPKKEDKKKETKKEEPKPAEDDDDDLFGEETEEDKAAKEAMKKQAQQKKKKEKKKEVEKSHVILEVKGWEKDQDLLALAEKIIKEIKKDGLKWNTGYKTEEVAFGIKKLIIALLVEDEKVSVQDIIDELESWEDDIQSVEIISFNKA